MTGNQKYFWNRPTSLTEDQIGRIMWSACMILMGVLAAFISISFGWWLFGLFMGAELGHLVGRRRATIDKKIRKAEEDAHAASEAPQTSMSDYQEGEAWGYLRGLKEARDGFY